jgi:hypothetical protein
MNNMKKHMALIFKKIDGVSLWDINRMLKKLSRSKLMILEQMKDNKIVIYLPSKTEREVTSLEKKKELLREIVQLDGFESFNISVLENCRPVYKEQLTKFGVYRWIELPLPNQIQYEYNFAEMKESIINNNYEVRPIM